MLLTWRLGKEVELGLVGPLSVSPDLLGYHVKCLRHDIPVRQHYKVEPGVDIAFPQFIHLLGKIKYFFIYYQFPEELPEIALAASISWRLCGVLGIVFN